MEQTYLYEKYTETMYSHDTVMTMLMFCIQIYPFLPCTESLRLDDQLITTYTVISFF